MVFLFACLCWTTLFTFAAASKNQTTSIKNVASPKLPTKPAATGTPAVGPAPASGTLSISNQTLAFADSVGPAPNATGEGVTSGAPTCAANGVDCSNYIVTLDPSIFTAASGYDPTKAYVLIQINWTPAAYEYGSFFEDSTGAVVAANTAGTDPETISVPVTSLHAGQYTIVTTLEIGTPGLGYGGNVSLFQPTPAGAAQCPSCIPPRYHMYFGPDNESGEPSMGVDWNPNVASLQQITAQTSAHGPTLLDTGGVSFFTANLNQYLVTFDDCSSPAINNWTAVTFPTEGVTTLDPIGFTDHFLAGDLGTGYPPPKTPGRTWQTQLSGVSSITAYTDTDGQGTPGYTQTEGGGPPTGPDHETDGVGPYAPTNTNVTPPVIEPPHPTYSNAVYYCSQNIVGDAECSRSDDGGLTFGPGIPIFQNLNECTGGIHGHVKVANDGTVYVPNFSCSVPGVGNQGVAVSTDNGITWTENNVTGSGSPKSTSSVDPQVAVALNSVGRPSGQTTPSIYFAYNDTDGTMKASISHDRGLSWSTPVDVGATFGIVNSTFPFVIAGDDDRAAVGFLGTTTGGDGNSDNAVCPPAASGQTAFTGIWHMYIATTLDGGNTWTTIDATPDSPVQVGPICRGGTLCPGYRNLLDFIGADVDSQGRAYFAIAHGCPNCPNVGAICGSSNALSAVFRQAGGPRLFSFFDSQPQANKIDIPANPQAVSATIVSGGVQVAWLEPDNGGSPITAYKIYRGASSGAETLLATVNNSPTDTQTKYLDTTATGNGNYFYHVTAVNGVGESGFCEELSPNANIDTGTTCSAPYVQVDGAGTAGSVPDPTGEETIESVNIGEPFTSCSDKSITFAMQVQTFDPTGTGTAVLPVNAEWRIRFQITDDSGNKETVFVSMDTEGTGTTPTSPEFSYGREDASLTGGSFDTSQCTAGGTSTCPTISGSFTAKGLITIKLTDTTLSFAAPTGATGNAFTWTPKKGTILQSIDGTTLLLVGGGGTGLLETVSEASAGAQFSGNYTLQGNLSCAMAPPIANLAANPLIGNAPLSVSFDGSGSSVATAVASCDTIATYALDFGDGSSPVTQATSHFSHTYGEPGSYPAKLTVTDTAGQTSNNLAQQVITVNSVSSPVLTSVVSRMTHGNTGAFDISLPLTGTRGVECRNSNALGTGNYTLVFTFNNNLMSVQGATVTLGAGTVNTASSSLGPNANQYTVNLTGVTNAQYIQVTLENAADNTGAIGNVTSPQLGVLVGDVNGTGVVDSGDVFLVRQQTGQNSSASNFREDVNATGLIDSGDVSLTRQQTGTSLPSSP